MTRRSLTTWAVARHYGGLRLVALTGVTFRYFTVFGLWDSAMVTLAFVIITVILGWRWGWCWASSAIATRASMRRCSRSTT